MACWEDDDALDELMATATEAEESLTGVAYRIFTGHRSVTKTDAARRVFALAKGKN